MPFRSPFDASITGRTADRGGARYCRSCGYRLDGLTQPRCPECSTGFDSNQPETFHTEPPEPTGRAFASVAIGLVVTAAVAGIVFAIVYLLSVAFRTP